MGGKGLGKRALYKVASRALKEKITRIKNEYLQNLQRINKKNSSLSWADWLKKESEQGNTTALAALRHRNQTNTGIHSLTGEGRKATTRPTVKPERITKNGTVLYRSGEATIRDTGQAVTATCWSDLAIKSALDVVTHHHGEAIVVNGSVEFQKKIVRSTVKQSLPVTFKAHNLEQLRVSLQQPKEPTPGQAVQDYIAEREAKRQSGIAIAPHKAFASTDKGHGTFQGIRRVSGQAMALVEKKNVMLVVPVTQYTEKRMKSLKKGEPVTLNQAGKIQARSRGR